MGSLSSFADTELIALIQASNNAAYKEVYDRYSLVLLNHIYNKTRDREEAKDIIHEVFASLWVNRESLDPARSLSGFLFTCARNVIFNQFNRKHVQKKYLSSLSEFALQDHFTADHRVREKIMTTIIEEEIDRLPKKTAEVFRLSRNEYLSHKEIAGKLRISDQTVSKHITNALKILRMRLGILFYILLVLFVVYIL